MADFELDIRPGWPAMLASDRLRLMLTGPVWYSCKVFGVFSGVKNFDTVLRAKNKSGGGITQWEAMAAH